MWKSQNRRQRHHQQGHDDPDEPDLRLFNAATSLRATVSRDSTPDRRDSTPDRRVSTPDRRVSTLCRSLLSSLANDRICAPSAERRRAVPAMKLGVSRAAVQAAAGWSRRQLAEEADQNGGESGTTNEEHDAAQIRRTSRFSTATSLRTSSESRGSTPDRRVLHFLETRVSTFCRAGSPTRSRVLASPWICAPSSRDDALASHGLHFPNRSIGCSRIHPGGQQDGKQGATVDSKARAAPRFRLRNRRDVSAASRPRGLRVVTPRDGVAFAPSFLLRSDGKASSFRGTRRELPSLLPTSGANVEKSKRSGKRRDWPTPAYAPRCRPQAATARMDRR